MAGSCSRGHGPWSRSYWSAWADVREGWFVEARWFAELGIGRSDRHRAQTHLAGTEDLTSAHEKILADLEARSERLR